MSGKGDTARRWLPSLLVVLIGLIGLAWTGTEFVSQIRFRNEAVFSSIGLYGADCPDALEIVQGEGKVIVAVIDSGISQELQNILQELNMFIPGINITDGSSDLTDTVGHGTNMVSLLATVFPNIQVLFIKTEKPKLSAYLDGIEYALRIAREQQAKLVVNISAGSSRAKWLEAYGGDVAAVDAALSQFEADFILFTEEAAIVAAAGNGGDKKKILGSEDADYPARFPGVISVGAAEGGSIAAYSSYGSLVDVYAPGNTLALSKNGNLMSIWGSSGASVIVSALAGLIWRENPDLTPDQVRNIITSYDNTTAIGSADKTGRLINCLAAVQFAQQGGTR